MKATITKVVEVEVEVEVNLEDLTDEQVMEEFEARGLEIDTEPDISRFTDDEIKREYIDRFPQTTTVEQIYEEFRNRGDAPRVLREFVYEQIGRILP